MPENFPALGQSLVDPPFAPGRTFHSYSGCDIRACVWSEAQQRFLQLANIQTLSYSIFRDKHPVRTLGATHVRRYTRGPRTIAGSIIFTVFDISVLGELLGLAPGEPEVGQFRPVLVDQLPPFHIVLLFASEYNYLSSMVIYGCEIVTEGQVMSVEDLITENTCQYVASYIAPLRRLSESTPQGTQLAARSFGDILAQPLLQELYQGRNPFDAQDSVLLWQVHQLAGGKRYHGD